jgi:hypothetical protein
MKFPVTARNSLFPNNFPGNLHIELIEKWLQRCGFLPRNRLTVSSRSSRQSFVRSGPGPFLRPTKVAPSPVRSDRPGRPSGRRASASPLMAASTMARLRSRGTMACIVANFASSMLSSAACAERSLLATHRADGLSVDLFAAFVTEASEPFGVPEHWICAVMHIESGD